MRFSIKFKALTIFLAVFISFSMGANTKNGKIRFAVGDARLIVASTNKERPAKIGDKVKDHDKIRTKTEARVVVQLPDGSTIAVEENSLVEFTKIVLENGNQQSLTEVIQGKIQFYAQKQTKNSTFMFKSGTATAAIRGTDGIVAITKDKQPVIGLNTGKMDVNDIDGTKISIGAGELMFKAPKGGLVKMELPNAGNTLLIDKLIKNLEDTTATLETITKNILIFKESLEKTINPIKEQTSCTFMPIPETTDTNFVVVKGTCNGNANIFINGNMVANPKQIRDTIKWENNSFGTKSIDILCEDTLDTRALAAQMGKKAKDIDKGQKMNISYSCGAFTTSYTKKAVVVPKRIFDISVDNDEICRNGSLTVRGTLPAPDEKSKPSTVTLWFSVGAFSDKINVSSTQETFEHVIPINDKNGSWEATILKVIATFHDGSSKAMSVPISINKACPKVNTICPRAKIIKAPKTKCYATFEIYNLEGDYATVVIKQDDNIIQELTVNGNTTGTFDLVSGYHKYNIELKDLAGNIGGATKTLQCYKTNNAFLTIDGKRSNSYEHLDLPKKSNQKTLYKTMEFRIENLPDRDFKLIKSITVSQSDVAKPLLKLNGSEIQNDVYNIPLTLKEEKTVISVIVELANGKTLERVKTFGIN